MDTQKKYFLNGNVCEEEGWKEESNWPRDGIRMAKSVREGSSSQSQPGKSNNSRPYGRLLERIMGMSVNASVPLSII